jgi:putative tryptophan/tyrosine transport system substrate-binding protein
MQRRQFITLLGGATTWPIAARAQQAGKLPTIGYLGGTTYSVEGPWAATFVQRLRELGWIEGRNFAIEYGWTEGRPDRAAEIVAEFVRMKVDVIVTSGTGQIIAAMKATSVTPIVFAAAGDPVGSGLVASLARPGGNVTGLSLLATDLAGKRIEFLREVGRRKPGQNPAAQQSPGPLRVCYPFRSELQEALGSETPRIYHAARRRSSDMAAGQTNWRAVCTIE